METIWVGFRTSSTRKRTERRCSRHACIRDYQTSGKHQSEVHDLYQFHHFRFPDFCFACVSSTLKRTILSIGLRVLVYQSGTEPNLWHFCTETVHHWTSQCRRVSDRILCDFVRRKMNQTRTEQGGHLIFNCLLRIRCSFLITARICCNISCTSPGKPAMYSSIVSGELSAVSSSILQFHNAFTALIMMQ